MTGQIGILNVGAGDTKLSFDPSKPDEVERAKAIVLDMIRRGYALLIEVGKNEKGEPLFQRAHDFDAATAEYIIVEAAPAAALVQLKPGDPPERKTRRRRIAASATSGVAVAPIAGG